MAFIVKSSQIFWQNFTEMLLEWSSTRQMILLPIPGFDCCHGNQHAKKEEYL